MPEVSVIVPNYNHAPYLKVRLNSILNQNYQDFEVIILDDSSTDASKGVLENYRGHPKVSQILYNDQNSGSPFRQWQKGIDLSLGKYIWIAESDDCCDLSLLQTLVPYLENGSDLAYCRSVRVDEFGNPTSGDYYWPDQLHKTRWRSNYTNEGSKEIEDYLIYRNTVPNASACLFRKEKLTFSMGKIIQMKFCGDWLFWVFYLNNARLTYEAQPLNFFRRHRGATNMTADRKSERQRLKEYWFVIESSRRLCGKGGYRVSEIKKYDWVFTEILDKLKLLGLFYSTFQILPFKVLPLYCLFLLKRLKKSSALLTTN